MHHDLTNIVRAMERDQVYARVPAGEAAAPLKPHYPQPLPASAEEIRVEANAAKVVKGLDHATSVLVVAGTIANIFVMMRVSADEGRNLCLLNIGIVSLLIVRCFPI